MLKEDLKLVAPTYTVTVNLVVVAQAKRGIPWYTPKLDAKVKMTSSEDHIPNQSKGKFSKDQPDSSKKTKVQKLYQHRSQWIPNSMHTHNMADCRKWNADGTSNFKSNKYRNYKGNNARAMECHMKVCFAQMRRDLKNDMQKESRF